MCNRIGAGAGFNPYLGDPLSDAASFNPQLQAQLQPQTQPTSIADLLQYVSQSQTCSQQPNIDTIKQVISAMEPQILQDLLSILGQGQSPAQSQFPVQVPVPVPVPYPQAQPYYGAPNYGAPQYDPNAAQLAAPSPYIVANPQPAPQPAPAPAANNAPDPKVASPLAFDLDGDGKVGTVGVGGKSIDINGDGKVDQSGWTGAGDGVLAFGNASSGKQLLGNATDINGDGKPDGYANGFEALKALATKYLGAQSVADGKLDQNELAALEQKTGLSMLKDGKRVSLRELGITEVDLGYKEAGANADANGNQHRQVGAGFVRNGRRGVVEDVWFKYR